MVVIPAMVPTQPLLALGFLPPPLGAAAASHPHFRLLRPEIPELAHPPGCDVTAAPCRAGPQDDSPPRERGAGPAPDQQRGAGLRRRRATMATGRSVAVRLLRPGGLPSPPPAHPPPPTRRGTLCRPALSTRRASAATHRTQAPNPGEKGMPPFYQEGTLYYGSLLSDPFVPQPHESLYSVEFGRKNRVLNLDKLYPDGLRIFPTLFGEI
uniref:Uncharacterized protein LOC112813768 isoform X2 n=1 Tax=Callorhinus ursinus TaxID=34884 RepID=A0A3Q7N4J0_CALUR|nr:uncharacterized protein LOC112813768 isoform X2 [Callorhinus ursinus]